MQSPPRPGPRVVGQEGERLGRGGLDHLPGRDAEPVAHQRELVGERDVDGAERVLVQLGGLGDLGAGDRDHRVDDLPVEQLGAPQALRRHARDELRACCGSCSPRCRGRRARARSRGRSRLPPFRPSARGSAARSPRSCPGWVVDWSTTSWPGLQVLGAPTRPRTRCRRGRACASSRAASARRSSARRGSARLRSRLSPQAPVEVRRSARRARRPGRSDAPADRLDPLLVEVDAGDLEPGLGELDRERQARVAQPDDADARFARRDSLLERRGAKRGASLHRRADATNRVSRRSIVDGFCCGGPAALGTRLRC